MIATHEFLLNFSYYKLSHKLLRNNREMKHFIHLKNNSLHIFPHCSQKRITKIAYKFK